MDPCAICGKAESEHHDFVSRIMPEGCKCDPGTWDDDVRKICYDHLGGESEYCARCGHDKACHEEET